MSMTRRFLPLLLTFLFAVTSAFADESLYQDAIINGREVEQDSLIAKSTVLVISTAGSTSCSGTVVANNLVITAGHCVTASNSNQPIPASGLLVDFSRYYNGSDQLPRASSVRVQEIRLHPRYRHDLVNQATNPHDIALIRLAAPVRPGYRPAPLIPRSLRLQAGNSVVVAGYGDRSFTDSSSDNRLLSFDFTVKSSRSDTSLVLLSATRAGGIGNGDSGGPAFVRANGTLYFWGVASSSEEEGWAEAAYENLEHYRDWLAQYGL